MSSRLEAALTGLRAERRVGLAPYITAGDGGLSTTLAVLHALEEAGASVVELGIPFSDPIADGPVLQAAAQRSLENGTQLSGILALVRRYRSQGGALPLLAFSYLNPLLSGGLRQTGQALADAGMDGVLVPDLPVEEAVPLREVCDAVHLDPVFFVTPTTSEERIAKAAEASRGFLYVVGRVGVTGGATDLDQDGGAYLERVRAVAGDMPLGVGFGIRDASQVRDLDGKAELAIVGSAMVKRIHAAVSACPPGTDAAGAGAAAARRYVAELLGRN